MSDKRERILAYQWALARYYSQKNLAVSREIGRILTRRKIASGQNSEQILSQ